MTSKTKEISTNELSVFNIKFSKTILRGAILYLGLLMSLRDLNLSSTKKKSIEKVLFILNSLLEED